MSPIGSNILAGASGQGAASKYEISKGLRFNSADSANLSRPFRTEGNRKKWTWSGWIKRNKIGTVQRIFAVSGGAGNNDSWFSIAFHSDDYIFLGGYTTYFRQTVGVFRDCSAWLHCVVSIDLDATTKMKIWVNGVEQTLSGTANPSAGTGINSALTHYLGVEGSSNYCDLQLADVYFIDGTTLESSVFGEYDNNGIWQPKEVTETAISAVKESEAPSGVTWNASKTWSKKVSPLGQIYYATPAAAFDGNSSSTYFSFQANQEMTLLTGESITASSLKVMGNMLGNVVIKVNGSAVTDDADGSMKWITLTGWSSPITSLTVEDTVQSSIRAIEIDSKILVDGGWGKNGFHLPFNDSTDIGKDTSVTEALDPRGGFSAVLYTGNGSTQSINALQFQPDFVWIKRRNTASDHQLYDSVRGAPRGLSSESTAAEWNYATGLKSFESDGFIIGSIGGANGSGDSHVAWCWKAGGPAVSNSDGSITSTVSADPNYGFSIVSYTGSGSTATVGHGLSAAPKFIIVKDRSAADSWMVWVTGFTSDEYLYLNGTDAKGSYSGTWGSTPTSSVFGVSDQSLNQSGNNFIAYCWSEVAGFSKFGSYASTGIAFAINTGFKPAFVMIKCTTTAAQEWVMFDAQRNSTNPANLYFYANYNHAEASYGNRMIKITDTGFELVGSDQAVNNSGDTYIYMAFADAESNPFTPHNLITEESTSAKDNFAAITWTGNGVNLSVGGQRFSEYSAVTGGTLTNAANAFNGSGSNWATLTASTSSTAAAVDFNFKTPITGVTKVEMAFDSPSASGDTRGRVNGANSGATRTGTSSGYSDVYTGYAITLTSVGWAINQNSATGTSSDIVSRIRITDSSGTYFLIDGQGTVGFQPDLVWIKDRGTTDVAGFFDSVRGSTKYLIPSTTGAEGTDANAVTSFTSTGFNLGSGYTSITTNHTSRNLVGWAWKAGGAASANSNGTITSQVSANPNFGFSIVTWSAASSAGTVGHGLSSPPEFILMKTRDQSGGWITYHEIVGTEQYLTLDSTTAASSNNLVYNTKPTSSVFTPGNGVVNTSAYGDMIAYCWSEVPGYSRFGSYTGTGSSQTITTGFQPAFVLIRAWETAANWYLLDSKRGSNWLEADGASAENSNSNISITYIGNGFTINGSNVNTSGTNYLYVAFAEPTNIDLDLYNDTPTASGADTGLGGEVVGNYATWNPLHSASGYTGALSNGNLTYVGTTWASLISTIAMTSGKWYCEMKLGGTSNTAPGVSDIAGAPANGYLGHASTNSYVWFHSHGLYTNSAYTTEAAPWSTARVAGEVVGMALDMDAGTLSYYSNGVLVGGAPAFTGITADRLFFSNCGYGVTEDWNFGQRSWAYEPPSGYKALCTTNLPNPTIADGSTYFDVRSGLSAQFTINDLKFEPDLVFAKSTSNSEYWIIADVLRSFVGGLQTNGTNSEGTGAAITSVGATGYQSSNNWFTGSRTYATFNWDAGSSTASNTDGSITSSVRANPSAGFSIVTWSGTSANATIGHGLNAAPEFILLKRRDSSSTGFYAYHSAVSPAKTLYLNGTTAAETYAAAYNDTAATSSVFSVGSAAATNSGNMLAYCFASVEGYSEFGSYTGNGSADGPFVYTGFRPAFLLWKRSNGAANWYIYDSARNTYNVVNNNLEPNTSDAENTLTSMNVDFTSNGFKIRGSDGDINASSGNYVYAAFAENSFKITRAR